MVRQAKGDKDRVVMLPRSVAAELRQQVLAARAMWEQDRQARGVGQRWWWFWVFPASSL